MLERSEKGGWQVKKENDKAIPTCKTVIDQDVECTFELYSQNN